MRPSTAGRVARHIRVAHRDWHWTISVSLAAVLLFASYFLPLWSMKLLAPQYPGGLELTAYGTRMTGDLAEINGLNHYIGVAAIEPDAVVELKLFPLLLFPAVAGLVALAVRGGLGRWRWAVAGALWMFPIGLLVDMQYWLYAYGHDLDPEAPVRVGEFTPKVIGSTQVLNFHSETMVAPGFWLMVGAAVAVTFGPALLRFVWASWNNTGKPAGAAALLLVAATLPAIHSNETHSVAPTIADMIAAAAPGETIDVPPGHYREQVVVEKAVTLEGHGAATIDGGGLGDVVVIARAGVTLRGFVIENSASDVSDEPAGIRVTAGQATVEDNVLRDVLYGIVLQESDGHTVRDNTISSMLQFAEERRGHAIYLWHTADNLISGNTVDGAKDGIFVGFGTRNLIENNRVEGVRYGIHYMYADDNVFRGNVFRNNIAGAALMYSRVLTLEDNEFSHNSSAASGFGLLMKDVDDVVMRGNRIFQNRIGLTMEGAPSTPGSSVLLEGNLVAYNGVAVELFTNTDVTFTGNSFIGNLRQVESRGGSLAASNAWSAGGVGNYWDDYRGYDADGDGIGDRPYEYAGAFNDLARDEPALEAFAFTPAQMALDLAANWFAAYEPDPAASDPHPLMAPNIRLRSAGSTSPSFPVIAAMSALVAIPLAAFVLARRSLAWRWSAC
jgi:nitrous oxidase accessory protein